MADLKQCEFFLLRYVPDAVKNEFVNIGLVLLESKGNGGDTYAGVRFTHDWRRVRCLDPGADVEVLEALELEIKDQLAGALDRAALIKRLEDSYSNVIQVSVTKGCETAEPQRELELLAGFYLEGPNQKTRQTSTGRQLIVRQMKEAFELAGVWALMRKSIAAADYTRKGDPLKIDCGYKPNGVVRLFHAVSLETDANSAKVLAFSYPQLVAGIARKEKAAAELTAVVEDRINREDEAIAFALATFQQYQIAVTAVSELPTIAQRARVELRV